MFHKFKKKTYSLGIDINSQHINLVLLKKKNNELQWCASVQYVLIPTATLKDSLFAAVTILKRKYGLPNCQVIMGLADEQVIQKELPIAKNLRENDIEWQIKQFSHDYFPDIVEELIVDFVKIHSSGSNINDNLKLFAAKAADISKKVEIIKSVGLTAVAIEPEIHSLIRLTIWQQQREPQPAVLMYAYLKEKNIKVIVMEESYCLFSNCQVNFSGYQNHLSGYLLALEQSMALFFQQQPQKTIQKIIVMDNLESSGDVLEKISEHFSVECDFLKINLCLFNASIVMSFKEQKLFIAIGLALRGVI